MRDIAETLADTTIVCRGAIDEMELSVRAFLRADTQAERLEALDRFDALRTQLERHLALLRGDLVRMFASEEPE